MGRADIEALQWGHRLSAMEGCHPHGGPRGHYNSFNGAIAFQRWKGGDDPHDRHVARSASMGPSPFSDGRRLRDVHEKVAADVLQWGHRLSAMEGGLGGRGDLPREGASMGPSPFSDGRWAFSVVPSWDTSCFNGAIAFQRWKGRRGSRIAARPQRRFNGAIAFQRWKARPRPLPRRRNRRFNGAIAFQRWKVGTPSRT